MFPGPSVEGRRLIEYGRIIESGRKLHTTTLGTGGRVVIPASQRKALGLRSGDKVVLELHDRQIRLYSPSESRKRAQDLVCRRVPDNVSLVDDLIRERRRESVRD